MMRRTAIRAGRLLVILCLCTALLTGCMHPVKINQRAIVQAIGIDYKDEKYKLSLQIFDSKGAGGQNAIDPSKVNSMLVECEGNTISEALEQASLKQGRQIFYGQNKLIVVGNEVAKRGLDSVIGFFNANHESRPNVDLVTAIGDASEILGAKVSQSVLPALSIRTMLENSRANAKILRGQVFHIVDAAENGNLGSYMPLVRKIELPDGSEQVEVAGTALFRSGKLAGAFGPDLTRGVLWLRGEVEATHIAVGDDGFGRVTLEVVDSSTQVKPRIRDGVPHFVIDCRVEAHVTEAIVLDDGSSLLERTGRLEQAASLVVQSEMRGALEYALGYCGSDVFGLSNLLEKYEPGWYAENAGRYEALLPSFTFDLKVETHISRYGLQG